MKLGRPPVRFCPKGHDKDVVGRVKSGKSCAECARSYGRQRRTNNPEAVHLIELRTHRRKIKNLPTTQGTICEICKTPELDRVLDADHNHETQEFRGWLCRHCNLLIGNCKENPNILRAAIRYLQRHQ